MRIAPWRWLVIFFTKPIHLADLFAFLRSRRKAAVPPSREPETETVRRRAPEKPRPAAAGPEVRVAWPALDSKPGMDVSEQPMDTLPGDLRDELLRAVAGAGKKAPTDPAA